MIIIVFLHIFAQLAMTRATELFSIFLCVYSIIFPGPRLFIIWIFWTSIEIIYQPRIEVKMFFYCF